MKTRKIFKTFIHKVEDKPTTKEVLIVKINAAIPFDHKNFQSCSGPYL
jgi:hypothetical protein